MHNPSYEITKERETRGRERKRRRDSELLFLYIIYAAKIHMQIANGRPICTGISSFSFSGDDYSIRSIGTRRVIYAIPFPRHKRNRFAEVHARRRVILSSRRFTRVPQILDRRIISRRSPRCVSARF